ncbi:MAG: glucose-1-phosphate adenylyltransferase subunit GlgD [Oscillospiraceae bacterium]
MKNVHGLIYAYHAYPELGALGTHRTGASLPFCGRYRLIDFALSGMKNAGIFNVSIIMRKGYQSLMEHLGGGRSWDMARTNGGLHMLPPYGMPDAEKGIYEGNMEALAAIYSYLVEDVKEEYIILARGDICANIDVRKVMEAHLAGGADITAVCTDQDLPYTHHSFLTDGNGAVTELLSHQGAGSKGLVSLEMYVLRRERLLEMIRWCSERNRLHFHRDALQHVMSEGWKVDTYVHEGYARHITSVEDYFRANMDMLDGEKRDQLFPADRQVTTQERSDVSTYYSETSRVKNSLIADGCMIEGTVENCILFTGVKVSQGSDLRNCIVLNDTVIQEGVELRNVISDKNVTISPYITLNGSSTLPLVIPKGSLV